MNKLHAYQNKKGGHFEKLAVLGNEGDPSARQNPSGIRMYHVHKRQRGVFLAVDDIKASRFEVERIKTEGSDDFEPGDRKLGSFKHSFPYASEEAEKSGPLFAIVRMKEIETRRRGFYFKTFKIKAIGTDLEKLKQAMPDFERDDPGERVCYGVREIRLMRSFDIDTKTQHKAFFVFGENYGERKKIAEDGFLFDKSVQRRMEKTQGAKATQLSEETVTAFESLLRQRKANSDKLSRDHAGLNRSLARKMKESIRNDMLAYLGEGGGVKYLACSSVPQKPYRYAPADYLAKQDKLPCRRLDALCPACAMFGTAALDTERPDKENAKPSAIKGKISFHGGQDISDETTPAEKFALKTLSSPKPTFYPFYILDNRIGGGKGLSGGGNFLDYDSQDARIGRKVYLRHNPNKLDFKDPRPSNLNCGIHPYPEGARFRFEIEFANLNNYELGLLLYSLQLDAPAETEESGETKHRYAFGLGMGKPLGLGACVVSGLKLTLWDPKKRYLDLKAGQDAISACNPDDARLFKKIFQYVQGAGDNEEFGRRLKEVSDVEDLAKLKLPDEKDIPKDFFRHPHIREFHDLLRFNVDSKSISDLSVCYAANRENSYEWYGEVKKHGRKTPGKALLPPSEFDVAKALSG